MTPSAHNHAASNITSGTLSIDRLPTVSIEKGGTGATTVEGALKNLGIDYLIPISSVDTTPGEKSILLSSRKTHVEYRFLSTSGISKISIGHGTFEEDEYFYTSAVFVSGSTPTVIYNPNGLVYFSGDNCSNGTFTPAANKMYKLQFWWSGISFYGSVTICG